jgi:DNA-binding LacI/PurR family transcriptional regulator
METPSRVTLKDVAAKAGVSYQTVSKVLNQQAQVTPETEARIWTAVSELNYQPNISARNLRTQASKLIGYGWSHPPGRSTHPVLDRFLHSAAHAAESYGYHLLTFVLGDDLNANLSAYNDLHARRQVDGFILANTVQDDPRIARLIEQQIPFVSFGQANDSWEFCWVDVDGRYGIELTVNHLLQRGHRRIAFITWPEGSQSGYHREQGYLYSLQEAGVIPNPAWIRRGQDMAQTGAEGLNELWALPEADRPTAVVCISDLIAIGAMNAAAAAGLAVGQDVAITGFDDVPMAEFLHPPLTTVRQPIAEAGQRIIDLLLAQINGEAFTCAGTLLRPELVVRESG